MESNSETSKARCTWLSTDPLYLKYHDEEWGVPVKDSERLFEMLCLEGQQSGLSWITILKKRTYYRKAFYDFNPWIISEMTSKDVDKILKNGKVIKHKQKLESIIENAKSYVLMESKGEDFSDFIWGCVGNEQIVNKYKSQSDIPVKTKESEKMSRDLKKRKFKFVGPTTCYAFMQACGLVNDHIIDCFCYEKCIMNKCF